MPSFPKPLFTIVIAAVLALATAGAARADQIIFSNFGPGMTFDANHGYTVAGSSALGTQVIANRFTATSNLSFSTAQLALGLSSGSPSILQVLLETDAGGLPGSIIETINVNIGPFPPGAVVTAMSALNPQLTSGANYWLVVYAPGPKTAAEWNFSLADVPTLNNFAANQIPSPTGPWYFASGPVRSAFQINGTPIPEPATLLLLGPALAVMVLRGQRKTTLGGYPRIKSVVKRTKPL